MKLGKLENYNYNRGSVERALTLHFGKGGNSGWVRNENGYVVSTGIGLVELKTLREAAIFVIACAEKGRRIEKEATTV